MLTKKEIIAKWAKLPDDAIILVIESEPSHDFDNQGLSVEDASVEPGDSSVSDNLGVGYIHIKGLEKR